MWVPFELGGWFMTLKVTTSTCVWSAGILGVKFQVCQHIHIIYIYILMCVSVSVSARYLLSCETNRAKILEAPPPHPKGDLETNLKEVGNHQNSLAFTWKTLKVPGMIYWFIWWCDSIRNWPYQYILSWNVLFPCCSPLIASHQKKNVEKHIQIWTWQNIFSVILSEKWWKTNAEECQCLTIT